MFPDYNDYVTEEYKRFFMSSLLMLGFNHISGDCMEFGCCGAVTLSIAYHASRYQGAAGRHLWACDSFQGLPAATSAFDDHPLWKSGNFFMSQQDFVAQCARNGVPETSYTIVPGFFSDTLSKLKNPNDIAMAFIDCDMYSSTVDVLTFLKPRLKHGMILAFDDYYCYSSTQPAGEKQAFDEFMASMPEWTSVPYHDFHWAGASFIIQRA
jgi:O-methyltransferase